MKATLVRMPKKRPKKKAKERPPQPSFLQRRSTKWLAAAIITLTIGIAVGVVGGTLGGDDVPSDTTLPTATAVSDS